MEYEDFIKTVLIKAAQIANDNFGKVTSTTKAGDNNQVLTETDIQVGKLIVNEIKTNFPEHNIIDEETGIIDHSSEFTWTIDPIDGTSNFANGIPTFCIMVGLLQNAAPIAGGIVLPFFSEYFIARKDQGTFCNGQKLLVTKEENLLKTLIAYGIDGHQENPEFTRKETKLLSEIVLNIRNLRTSNSCYDAVQVAKGNYGAWLNQTSKIWDNVAIQVLIEEAGGIYTDFWGKPMDYSHPLTKANNNFTVCAAPPILHKKLQEIIHKFI